MNSQETLNPRRFTSAIQSQTEFRAALPTAERFQALEDKDKQHYRKRAIAAGAISHAMRLEKERGEYDLDANLFKLVGELESFYTNKSTITSLSDAYEGGPPTMPRHIKDKFYASKDAVISFNHTLREVINAGASRFDFHELLTFMTNMHMAAGGQKTAANFQELAKDSLVGMRNEIAFEQILIANDIDYELGSVEQDATGGDFIIEGVPVDVKSSPSAVEKARQKAMREGRDPNLIMWSHIRFEDYEGKLTLPYEKNGAVFARVEPYIDRAIRSFDARAAV
ncbi:MAG TPA: hypothetical protein VFZ62_01315 [Candidatus Saccharimonadales bacterium]